MLLFGEKNKWPSLSLPEIKKRSTVIVIDDSDFAYIELFLRDDYNIKKWDDIKDISKLERNFFDIILMDLKGIGTEISEHEGLGVISHIKENNPSQIVLAYSNSEFDTSYQRFFDLADEIIPKGSDYLGFKVVVDKWLKEKFSAGFYLAKIEHELQKSGMDYSKAIKAYRKAILTMDRSQIGKLKKQAAKLDNVNIDRITSITTLAIEIGKLCFQLV